MRLTFRATILAGPKRPGLVEELGPGLDALGAEKGKPSMPTISEACAPGDPYGNRTRVFAVKGDSSIISTGSSPFGQESPPMLINDLQGWGYQQPASDPRNHSTCCSALMLGFFATLNADLAALAQAHAAARECEGRDEFTLTEKDEA